MNRFGRNEEKIFTKGRMKINPISEWYVEYDSYDKEVNSRDYI